MLNRLMFGCMPGPVPERLTAVYTQAVDAWKHVTSDSELQNPSAAAVQVNVLLPSS